MLQPSEVIESAQSPVCPRAFVVGAFDGRITFFSQQVRGLALAHALVDQALIQPNSKVCVVGGGAAGMAAAAGLAMLLPVQVDLIEKSHQLLPIQAASNRRRLDPHIYQWPKPGSDDLEAELPILDWASGPSAEVRRLVNIEFETLALRLANLRVLKSHEVVGSRVEGSRIYLNIHRQLGVGEVANTIDNRFAFEPGYDVAILAFGFGAEPRAVIDGVQSRSYWSDAGVPEQNIFASATSRFLVSGSGDGGLIDLVAAASAEFDHGGIIQLITGFPGIEKLHHAIEDVDEAARNAKRRGERFDFLQAYDNAVGTEVERLGLLADIRRRLRTGVQLILHTREADALVVDTAALNRLAAYLTIRACQSGQNTSFQHLHGRDLLRIAAPADPPYSAELWFECDGLQFGVDDAVIRRGPNRAAARLPFADLIAGFEQAHQAWFDRTGDRAIVPRLSEVAFEAFRDSARSKGVAPAAHVAARNGGNSRQVRLQSYRDEVRWSGDVPLSSVEQFWSDSSTKYTIMVPVTPEQVGRKVAVAIIRLALHSDRVEISADSFAWSRLISELTQASEHTDRLPAPILIAARKGAAIRNVTSAASHGLATAINGQLNRLVLTRIASDLQDFLSTGLDSRRVVGFRVGADLRQAMYELWLEWLQQLEADPDVLDRFLRLTVCAKESTAYEDSSRVLVGPVLMDVMTKATAAALAVASAWPNTKPHGGGPGNLVRTGVDPAPTSGHVCAARLIDFESTAVRAPSYGWSSAFVLLSEIDTPLHVASLATRRFSELEHVQPRFTELGGAPGLLLTLDERFRRAAERGIASLRDCLDAIKSEHFKTLLAEVIERRTHE